MHAFGSPNAFQNKKSLSLALAHGLRAPIVPALLPAESKQRFLASAYGQLRRTTDMTRYARSTIRAFNAEPKLTVLWQLDCSNRSRLRKSKRHSAESAFARRDFMVTLLKQSSALLLVASTMSATASEGFAYPANEPGSATPVQSAQHLTPSRQQVLRRLRLRPAASGRITAGVCKVGVSDSVRLWRTQNRADLSRGLPC